MTKMIDAYIIYNSKSINSVESANVCARSAEQFGLNVIYFDGIYSGMFDIIQREQLRLPITKKLRDDAFVDQWFGPKLGVVGCFLSHYFLYKEIIKKGKPCLILEHDAVVKNHIDHLLPHLVDCMHLDIARNLDMPDYKNFKNGVNYIEQLPATDQNISNSFVWKKNWIRGTHGYLLSPSGAEKIVQWIKKYFILPSDWLLNNKILTLQYCTNQYIAVQDSMIQTSTTGPIDYDNLHDTTELRKFYQHCLTIDSLTLSDSDEVVELTPNEIAKLKYITYTLNQRAILEHNQMYNIIKSSIDLEQLKKIIC